MDFESDPAADFLNRERELLGDLENEISTTNGTVTKQLTKLGLLSLKHNSHDSLLVSSWQTNKSIRDLQATIL
jgi:hypothetical protein